MQFVEDALVEDPKKLPMSLNDRKSKYHFFFKLKTSAPYGIISLSEANKVFHAAMRLPKVSILFDNDRKKHFLMHLTLHHALVFNTNRIESETDSFVAYVTSLINHSCTPNIMRTAQGDCTYNVTGRPIKKEEQLFSRYSGVSDVPSNIQKSHLKSRWGFDCKCEKCEPKRKPIDRKLIISDPCYKFVLKNQENTPYSAIVREKYIKFLNKYGSSS